ncbi:hypothetical protein A3H38_05885 [candidate division WOR-1 bacterium RIFCSPLOWO2_02_FULL_46_20]|uniref:DUF8173 domain-containing protein n=2 Tax=Saganbacteria TaxID=1703751 RepID=A0A1F4RDE6_UNCSA|nr:MAG: hypothetical protein A3J44_04485 [candidate division WOR-1 bacterium RIFCSPHIGHO2_02_FULL_45_12]OGC05493.1 MAG: hypothetical protein A3H38_05885 [candidate division WOR-1 bacterium RIFCSPLOWO2_02_FULL_46_20]OGC08135.1 MAG: hypothetical protein A3F86_01055 [candidate division WOR-1 bacterium RIFCSPLOWO2_12_FULL_45_9]
MLRKVFVLLLIGTVVCFGSVALADQQALVKVGKNIEVPVGIEVKSAVSVGGSVTVYGKVLEDVVAVGGSVYLKDGALVDGNVVSVGGNIEKGPGAMVKGDVTEIALPGGLAMGAFVGKGMIVFSILSFVGFLVLVIILVALFPTQLGNISGIIQKEPGKNFGIGLLALLLFVPIAILLAISIVGIVLIPVWGIVFVSAGLIGYLAAANFIGKKVLLAFKQKKMTLMIETLLGVVILSLIGLVPFVGFIVKAVAGCVGLGGVTLTRFGTQKA